MVKTKTLRVIKMPNQKTKNAQKEDACCQKTEKKRADCDKKTKAVAQALDNFF